MISETLITAAATQMIKSFVEELFVPKFKKFQKTANIGSAKLLNRNKGYFNEYLIRTYDKYSNINTLAFQNSQRRLKDIYVAQSLVKETSFVEDDFIELIDNNKENNVEKIDEFPEKLIQKYKKILITDTAGMGKSTIMKYMFLDLIDKGLKDVGIPISIELNRLNKGHSILTEIQEELNSLSENFDNDLLLNFIQTGGFIFFLDGYDEISIADKIEVTKDIQTFISKAGTQNYYILTSRPENSLASFGDFQSFRIQPLSINEAFELLTKYDFSTTKRISKEIIAELQTGKYDSIKEYLVNPLLVSLLYNAYRYKTEIPLKKHQFYRQVYDALYNAHKLAQGKKPHEKYSGLDIDDFNRILRYLGCKFLINDDVQFDEDTILSAIRDAKKFCGNLEFRDSGFLKDLITTVPLFIKDGTEFKWAHKSLMEYFAARFIADEAKEYQDKILTAINRSDSVEKYINMLDLYYDIDYKGFSKGFLLPFLEEYVEYHDRIYPEKSIITKDLIEARIGLLFCIDQIGIIRSKYYIETSNDEQLAKKNSFESTASIRHGQKKSFKCGLPGFDVLGITTDHYYAIQGFIFKKQPNLIKQYTEINPGPINVDFINQDKIYKIDAMTGSDDSSSYILINNMLTYASEINNTEFSCNKYLDYNAVLQEIEKIKNEIRKSNGTDLFDGI